MLMPSHWVQATKATTGRLVPAWQKALVPIRAPYRFRLHKCPPVILTESEPWSTNYELNSLTTKLAMC